MTLLPAGVKEHVAYGYTDMRKGNDGLALMAQEMLHQSPFSGRKVCTSTVGAIFSTPNSDRI